MGEKNFDPDAPRAPASTQDGINKLYATKQTKNNLGWIGDRMPGIAEADIIVLQPDDLKSGSARELRTLFNKVAPADVLKTLDRELSKADWDRLAQSVKAGASARSLDFNRDGKNDLGIIMTGKMNETPEEFATALTMITGIRNMPGDAEDYLAFTMFHESAHVAQPLYGSGPGYAVAPLPYEIDADVKSVRHYREAIQDKMPLDPNVPDAVRDMRLGSSLVNSGGFVESMMCAMRMAKENCIVSHDTHLGIDAHENSAGFPVPKTGNREEMAGLLFAKSIIHVAQGELNLISMKQHLIETGTLSDTARMFFDKPLDLASDKSLKKRIEIGNLMSSIDPLGNKAILDKMDKAGYFSQMPDVKAYIKQMDTFFDKYSPDYKDDPEYTKFAEVLDKLPVLNPLSLGLPNAPASETQKPVTSPGLVPGPKN